MPPIDRLEEVGLFRLGRHPRTRPSPLDIGNHHGQFNRGGEPHGLTLEIHPRATGCRNGQRPAKSGAQGSSHPGNFVFRLERIDVVVFVLGEFVQYIAGRRNRVAAQKERQPGLLGGNHKTESGCRVSRDITIRPRIDLGRFDLIGRGKHVGVFAQVIAAFDGQGVGFGDNRGLAEPLLYPLQGRLNRTIKEPGHHAEGKKVSTPHDRPVWQARILQSQGRHFGDFHLIDLVFIERIILKRVVFVFGLSQVGRGKFSRVNNENAVLLQIGNIGFERGRIHAHQGIEIISRCIDIFITKVDLKGAHAVQRPRGSPDFRRKVRQRSDIIPGKNGFGCKTGAGQLHAVPGITGKTNNDAFPLLRRFL